MNFSFDTIIIMLGWLLLANCVGVSALSVAVLLVLQAGKRAAPALGTADTVALEGWPRVSVVIPAHNEEALISEALASISASDYAGVLEIILVADRCRDRTVELARNCAARDRRIQIVELAACPAGWSGKCHSCWQGAERARGALILFTDADTLFAPELIRAAVGYLQTRRLDFLSILGSLRFTKSFEKVAQPIAALVLMRLYPIHRANRADPAKRRPFANGQFMLFTRAAYEGVGTHAAVKDAILEDLRFARRLTRHGYQLGLTTARDLFTVRMYETAAEFRRGWKRILIEGTGRNIARLRASAWRLQVLAAAPLLVVAACFYGLAAFFNPPGLSPLVISGLGFMTLFLGLSALAAVYRIQGAPLHLIRFFPFGCLQLAAILRTAIVDLKEKRGIEWADLHYEVDAREER